MESSPEKPQVVNDIVGPTNDPEKAASPSAEHDNGDADLSLLVTWEGDADPANPKNWSLTRKWSITVLLSLSGLVFLISMTMLAPALGDIAQEFSISPAKANMTLSIFLLAVAVGPMFLAPFAEVFGRRKVWFAAAVWYAAWDLACGFANGSGMLLAARLLAGFGSSAEFVVSSPVLGDIWPPEQRGLSFAISTFLPLLGPAIGPLLGGVITTALGWRWCFWILAVADVILMLLATVMLPETYGPLVLRRKAVRLTKETGRQHYTDLGARIQPLRTKFRHAVFRPVRLLVTQPIIQLMSLFLAFNYGTLFFVLTNYSTLWTDKYHESVQASGYHYIAIVIGYTIAAQGGARITDQLWQYLKRKRNGQTMPEYRVPLMIPGNVLILCGLLWIGWSAEKQTQWAVVDTGAVIFGCGIVLSTQAMQQYVMESFPDYVASASAASQLLRGLFGFAFPLFAPVLYTSLGYGWGNTTLALVYLVLASSGPVLLWFYGSNLRARGYGESE
ncbi:membrane transport protein [Myriangium duriaei CBS 260.36]|uniref:Membrane transport protein n=1 Tax=Myriangium duriaei CBS 260.36 TaxID=1168546 RepID=A0A9P4MDP9_9PEZI|nr:membrane transport protein [Myriangium duriaei CBS 260.36]